MTSAPRAHVNVPAPSHRRTWLRLSRHYLEMVVAMGVGMLVLGCAMGFMVLAHGVMQLAMLAVLLRRRHEMAHC